MASTNFVDNSSVIYASWLNNVNEAVYNGNFQATTISPVNLICNGSVSGTGFNGLVNSALGSPAAIGNGTPNTGAFTTLSSTGLATLNSINITNGVISRNVDASGYCYRLTPSASGTQSIIQWVNLAGSVQWTGLIGSNNLLQCITEFAATSFTGAGTGLTGTSNSLNAGIGVNQTWQSFSGAQRPSATWFQNTTGKPINVAMMSTGDRRTQQMLVNPSAASTSGAITIAFSLQDTGTNNTFNTLYGIIPNGYYYYVSYNGSFNFWSELK